MPRPIVHVPHERTGTITDYVFFTRSLTILPLSYELRMMHDSQNKTSCSRMKMESERERKRHRTLCCFIIRFVIRNIYRNDYRLIISMNYHKCWNDLQLTYTSKFIIKNTQDLSVSDWVEYSLDRLVQIIQSMFTVA